ncbi:site-specific integrase [Sulfurimonas sp. C5]|uniref:tyrosine-type recombinase/integrase n=1 Tax=Sulfurimonas sp. C5 TaxID=3036947 RepID=UPI002455C277|nr:site-specific integrase [Sulfurimonas sp. C5]MDH4943967.1 site-specific integrase [Sulfurimonas sp. C5]
MALKPASKKYQGVWINELKNGDVSYYINYRDIDGISKRVLVGKKTRFHDFTIKDAYQKLIETKFKIQTDEVPQIKGTRVAKIKFDNLWIKYLEYAKSNKKTWRDDEIRYRKHIQPRVGNKIVKSLKPLDFEKMKAELSAKGLSASSVKHCLAIARQVFNFAIKNDLIQNVPNPIANGRVKMPELDNARLAYLTVEQAKEILEILKLLSKNTYHLASFLLFTGARFSEVATLRWQDIDFNTNTIYFKKNKKGNSRHIAISPQLMDILEKEMRKGEPTELLFTRKNGTPYRSMPKYFISAVNAVIPNNDKKEAKYKITTHSLRHTHASWLASTGLDILQIKEQLGHKTIEMTMRYSHLIPNKRHEATQSLSI